MVKKENKYSDILPKSFYLGGKKFNVRFSNAISDGSAHGKFQNSTQNITIATLVPEGEDVVIMSQQYMEQTFYHELVHDILIQMSEFDLSKDEKFVDLFSVFLHQFMVTKRK